MLMCSCGSVSLPSLPTFKTSDPENYPIYAVMIQGAPFYLDRSPEGLGGGKDHPFLYLPKDTTVSLLNTGKKYSKVSLLNGMQGWMPISTLAPQMSTGESPSPGVTPSPGQSGPSDNQNKANDRHNPDATTKLPSY